jgi:Protein of unknown function (DUF3572)
MPSKLRLSPAEAEVIALKCLVFLAEDEQRVNRFMSLSGLSPGDLRAGANQPEFLAGVLDYLLSDEKLLLAFIGSHGLEPEIPGLARRLLPGLAEW